MSGFRWRVGVVLLPVACSLLTACTLRDRLRNVLRREERPAVAVRVGERMYVRSDLERFFDSRLNEFRDPSDADTVRSRLLESFVEEKLLLREAERLKVEVSPEVVRSMILAMSRGDGARGTELERSVAEDLRIQQYLHDHLFRGVEVTAAECEAYYKAHQGEFVSSDVVRVREILVDSLSLAERMRALLAASRNKNFADLARMHSRGPNAANGGDLGEFQRGDLPEEFEKAIFRLSPGSVTKVVRSRYGYHLFLVEERTRARQQRLYEVKEQIREKLQQEREREIINRELARLAVEVPVEIHRDGLSFNYTGTRFAAR